MNDHSADVERYYLELLVFALLFFVSTVFWRVSLLSVELEAATELRMLQYQTFDAGHRILLIWRILTHHLFILVKRS